MNILNSLFMFVFCCAIILAYLFMGLLVMVFITEEYPKFHYYPYNEMVSDAIMFFWPIAIIITAIVELNKFIRKKSGGN